MAVNSSSHKKKHLKRPGVVSKKKCELVYDSRYSNTKPPFNKKDGNRKNRR